MKNSVVDMNHGSGGQAMESLINTVFRQRLGNPILATADDFAALPPLPPGQIIVSTDSYVISPLFFPGGDIGSLAVHGTVNDVSMSGAKPIYLTASFILEEGFPFTELVTIADSMGRAARDAGVQIIAGDTKVVQKGKGDGVYINTTGVGVRQIDVGWAGNRAKSGDKILVNGTLGDHGVAILTRRENLDFGSDIVSDSAALNHLVLDLVKDFASSIHCMRDATRGGLAAVLNELATQSGVGMDIDEQLLPVMPSVQAACELLGLDPLSIANEGKLVCVCESAVADQLLCAMQENPLGRNAAIIGDVNLTAPGTVTMQTLLGGRRRVEWPLGELLPRIC